MEEPWVEFVFWFSLLALGYTYVGYPFVLWVWARIGPCQVSHASKESIVPSVSIVIAARNEAARLATRIENCLTQRYPPDRLHVIVVSDGSTDQTEEVVGRFDPARVTLVILKESQGKAGALNAGVARSESEIIVFADARQRFGLSAVEELVRNFADPSVGAVSGELILHSPVEGPGAEAVGVYWAIEKWIRRAEGAIDSVIGTTGAIYAIRRTLYEPLPSGAILDDLLVPMRIAMRGSRVVFEPRARAFDWIEQDYHAEFTRKVRTLAGNYQAISLCPDLIKPWRNRLFLQFVSHKVCRLASPFWLGVLFLSNLLLLEG
jgi:biofilm PGA synthesis N-glycosyltransferase PgaC